MAEAAGRWLIGWAAAALAATLLGAVAEAQLTLALLPPTVGTITLDDRVRQTLTTLQGFAPQFGAIVAGALFVLLLIAAGLGRALPRQRGVFFALAGAAAPILVALGLKAVFDVPVVAGAETPIGLFVHGCAGGLAGAIGAIVSVKRLKRGPGAVTSAAPP